MNPTTQKNPKRAGRPKGAQNKRKKKIHIHAGLDPNNHYIITQMPEKTFSKKLNYFIRTYIKYQEYANQYYNECQSLKKDKTHLNQLINKLTEENRQLKDQIQPQTEMKKE